MKKAVITSGGKQYIVSEGDELEVELLSEEKNTAFDVLMLIDGEKTTVGKPTISGAQVKVDVLEPDVRQEKVIAIRYKAKKRVHKRRGHRQRLAKIKVKSIAS